MFLTFCGNMIPEDENVGEEITNNNAGQHKMNGYMAAVVELFDVPRFHTMSVVGNEGLTQKSNSYCCNVKQ